MDDFLLFTFMSTEGIVANEDAENMFIGIMVGIIFSRKNQKWAKFFHHLTLVTVHISYLNEAKHQACQGFQRLVKLIVNLNHGYKGGKMTIHADQTLCKDLKYLKFCCSDVFSGWNVPKMVVNYCLPSRHLPAQS